MRTRFTGQQSFLDRRIDFQYAGYYTLLHLYSLDDTTAQVVRKGFCQLVTGKYAAAIESLTEAEKSDTTALTPFLKAVAYEHSENFVRAYQFYEKALKIDNNIVDAHKKRGVFQSKMKRWEDAILEFSEVIRINPAAFVVYKFRGVAYLEKTEYAKAKTDFSTIIQNDSTDKDVFRLRATCYKNLGEELNAAGDLLELARDDYLEFPSLHEAVYFLLKHGDTTRADLELANYRTKFPQLLGPKTLQIRLWAERNDWSRVSREIDQVLGSINKGAYERNVYSYLLMVKGKCQQLEKKNTAAIETLTESIRIDPINGRAYFERGLVLLAQRKSKAALHDFTMAKSLGILEADKFLE